MSFKNFINEAHCENHIPSSKRFWGGMMIACSQICIMVAAVLSFIKGQGITEVIKDLIEMDIIVGASLLGLNTITRAFGNSSITTENCKE